MHIGTTVTQFIIEEHRKVKATGEVTAGGKDVVSGCLLQLLPGNFHREPESTSCGSRRHACYAGILRIPRYRAPGWW